MNTLIFYEKPGCITNNKQKKLLRNLKITFKAIDLVSFPWTKQRLQCFFSALPVTQWINPNSPRVKSGEVIPSKLSKHQAITLMVKDPILIRRPLIEYQSKKLVGFDLQQIALAIGISIDLSNSTNLESCSLQQQNISR